MNTTCNSFVLLFFFKQGRAEVASIESCAIESRLGLGLGAVVQIRPPTQCRARPCGCSGQPPAPNHHAPCEEEREPSAPGPPRDIPPTVRWPPRHGPPSNPHQGVRVEYPGRSDRRPPPVQPPLPPLLSSPSYYVSPRARLVSESCSCYSSSAPGMTRTTLPWPSQP